jgi:glycosyltransferase involved in cell wall biosynthesis
MKLSPEPEAGRLRILFLTQVLPYPVDAGPKTRAYYTLRQLAGRHDVTLLSFVRKDDTASAVDHLRTLCESVHTVPIRRAALRDASHWLASLPSATPFLIARDRDARMARAVRELMRGSRPFDAIHADQLWMAPYATAGSEAAAAIAARRPALVLDQHNAVFQIPLRVASHERNRLKRVALRIEAHKLAAYEARVCSRFDRVTWVSDADRRALYARARNSEREALGQGSVIPICLPLNERPLLERRPNPRRVTFLGGLHWPPNAEGLVWFAREIWPRVHRQVPNAVLTVIGKTAPSMIPGLAPAAGVELTGYVADPIPYLEETAAVIAPLLSGGGMRVKILDALAWGLPIVSTRLGAEGIQIQGGRQALLADTPEAFAAAVVSLLHDQCLQQKLASEGRRLVEAQYDCGKVYQAWDHLYASL